MKSQFEVIETFTDEIQAHAAKGKLESEGIEAQILDSNIVRMNWLFSNAIGGVKVQVRSDQIEQAREILAQDHSKEMDQKFPESDYFCPHCKSSNVARRRSLHPLGFLLSLAFYLFPWVQEIWVCRDCQKTWKLF